MGHAASIEIHYNTNGTIFPLGAEEIWRHFKHVEIAFSVDDVGDRFEYQRTNAEWLPVNSNIQLFREMRERHSNISLQVCCTINVFNVLYLDQVAAWIDTQDFDYVYWNMLHDAAHFCIATLPLHTKLLIENKLRSAKFSQKHQIEINRVIDFMTQGTSQDVGVLHQSIRLVDARRRQNIALVSPEFAAAINYAT
jgi:hypothetical protein